MAHHYRLRQFRSRACRWPGQLRHQWVYAAILLQMLMDDASASVSVYTSQIENGLYPALLGGSSLLETIYESYNSTGLMALGGLLLAAGGEYFDSSFSKVTTV